MTEPTWHELLADAKEALYDLQRKLAALQRTPFENEYVDAHATEAQLLADSIGVQLKYAKLAQRNR